MRHLPVEERGYPVPWFVAFIDGKPDFRVVRTNGITDAWRNKWCWLCGGVMGVYKACVIGPMCGINRITSEPPSHLECAEFAVRACPFLTQPLAKRVERGLPEDQHVPGVAITRNPGVCMIWVTKHMKPFRVPKDKGGGVLFQIGDPTSYSFWHKGRRATREEIDHSVNTGLPLLEEYARKDGPRGIVALAAMKARFEKLLPPKLPVATVTNQTIVSNEVIT